MTFDQWVRLQFERVKTASVIESKTIESWQVRVGSYHPEGNSWDHDFKPIAEGDYWGRPDGLVHFHATTEVPLTMADRQIWLRFLTAAEVIIYLNGQMQDGIDPNRTQSPIIDCAEPGQKLDLLLEAYTRSIPDDSRNVRTMDYRGCVQKFYTPQLLVFDEPTLQVSYDLDILYQMAFDTSICDDHQAYLLHHINELLKRFPAYDAPAQELRSGSSDIQHYLNQHIYNKATSPFGHTGKLACVAHSHLDVAYHWKIIQAVQKNARTCLIQLRLMERHPDFTYSHSQPWTYEMLEKYYPHLFEQVKQRIAEGRWELVGGMYVEPDCNIPSVESLIRQVVYGKRYFLEKFGVEVDNCWLPDVFGNSPCMPQLLKAGGIDYFISNKMSTWNDTNEFPHNNFRWRGIDGTEILASVPPTHFNAWMEPAQILENWNQFLDKNVCDESLQMYGYGDGGGGITEELFSHFRRLERMPEIPQLRLTSAKEYLRSQLGDKADKLAVWDGELYLEMHRGTFTTKGKLKQLNRQYEFLAQETETACTLAALQGNEYPAAKLRQAWKKLLTNQFHDIVPGSHTTPVYYEAIEIYNQVKQELDTLYTEAMDRIAPYTDKHDLCVFNPFSSTRSGIAYIDPGQALDLQAVMDTSGRLYHAQQQHIPGSHICRTAVKVPQVPATGFVYLKDISHNHIESVKSQLNVSPTMLENKYFALTFDDQMRLVSVIDKLRNREVLAEGAIGNDWQMFEDKPGIYNAWDILPNYKDHPLSTGDWQFDGVVESGPISAAIKLKRRFSRSEAQQIIRLHEDIPRIDFENWIDWQETEKLLKVAFPLSIKARTFTTDTSAGGFERENHNNTTWQQARFEVCSHKWTDLSEGLFGVSLMNDCKYGCDVSGNVIRLSLLKSPVRPDPVSDKEQHQFTYSLFTHNGDWRSGGVVEAAYDLNWPMRIVIGRKPVEQVCSGCIRIDQPAIRCLAVKGDEDAAGDVVIRVIELYGSRGTAKIMTHFPFNQACLCDTLERENKILHHNNNEFELEYKPYQLQTIRFKRQR